jgi:hypothetical protein
MPSYNDEDGIDVTYVDYPDSSFIRMIAYDAETGELYVQLNDSVYVYTQVLEEVYHNFIGVSSAGHFYDTQVKGIYKSQYVGDKDDYGIMVRPVVAAPSAPAGTLTEPGPDKSWFNVTYTVTKTCTDTVIARSLADAIKIVEEDASAEGFENVVVVSGRVTS